MSWKFLLWGLLAAATVLHTRSQDVSNSFDHSDLSVIVESEHGEFQLEAYKAAHNDRVLKSDGERKISQLQWVSLGEPKLVLAPNRRNSSKGVIFDIKFDRVSVQINTLTASHRKKLAAAAGSKYHVNISEDQIVHLPLSHVECRVAMLDDDGKLFILTGNAGNFQTFPIRVDFMAPKNSRERLMFDHLLKNNSDELTVECQFSAKGKKSRMSMLEISSQQIEQLELVSKLFGQAAQVFVTREQLIQLAYELYSALFIAEVFEIPRYQFSDAFNDGLLQQTMLSTYNDVNIDEALPMMSRYATGFDKNESLDEIKDNLVNLIKVIHVDGHKKIGFQREAFAFLGTSVFGAKIVRFLESRKVSSHDSTLHHKSLDDLLTELNSDPENDIRWMFKDDRLIPQSMRVASLWRGNFNRTLRFSRVVREVIEASFSLTVRLEIANTEQRVVALDRVTQQMHRQQHQIEKFQANFDKLLPQVAELSVLLRNMREELNLIKKGTSLQQIEPRENTGEEGHLTNQTLLLGMGYTKEYDGSPLHWASEKGHVNVVKMLLDKGENIEAKENSSNMTSLHIASLKGQLEVVQLLLDRGADIEAKNDENRTPLHYAVCEDHVDVAELLLDRGANIEARLFIKNDYENVTPLHHTAVHGHIDSAKLLLDRGADINARDDKNITPLAMAIKYGKTEIAAFLRQHGGLT